MRTRLRKLYQSPLQRHDAKAHSDAMLDAGYFRYIGLLRQSVEHGRRDLSRGGRAVHSVSQCREHDAGHAAMSEHSEMVVGPYRPQVIWVYLDFVEPHHGFNL